MEIHRNIYQKLYDDILAHFRDTVLEETDWITNGRPFKKDSRQWWEVTRTVHNSTNNVSRVIAGDASADPFIYYRILKGYNSSVKINGVIDILNYQDIKDTVVINGLIFLGYKIPEIIKEKSTHIITDELKAKLLMQIYLNDKYPECLLQFPALQVYNFEENTFINDYSSDSLKEENRVLKNNKISEATENAQQIVFNEISIFLQSTLPKLADDRFRFELEYDNIIPKEILNSLPKRNPYEVCEAYFNNLIKIENVRVVNFRAYDDTWAICDVYYRESSYKFSSKLFESLIDYKVSEFDKAFEAIKKTIALIQQNFSEDVLKKIDFQNFQLIDLISGHHNGNLAFYANDESNLEDAFENVFPRQTIVKYIDRLKEVFVTKTDGKWTIHYMQEAAYNGGW